jgi:hypothetical protein
LQELRKELPTLRFFDASRNEIILNADKSPIAEEESKP